MNKTDARIINTKRYLKEALINLLSDNKLSNIKISTLCNSAEINRATFYSHYKDVNDLFEEIIDEFMANICNYIATLYSLENQDRKEEFMNFVKYVDNNSDIFLLIFENSTNIEFTSTQYLELHQKIHRKISTSYNQNTYATYITNFFIYSGGSVLYTWIKNGKKETYLELISVLSSLIIKGASVYIRI